MQAFGLRRSLAGTVSLSFRRRPVASRTLWHFRTQATLTSSRPAVTATNRAEATLKRFWKSVNIEQRDDGIIVALDKRPLKTPSGNTLLVPPEKSLAATLIAAEWDNQDTLLKQHSLPMTSIACRAIDSFDQEITRSEVRSQLLKYLQTDAICFHQKEPAALVSQQKKHWEPLLEWARSTFDVEINTTDSFFLTPHPLQTSQKFDEVMARFDPWEMAALERATYTSKSFIIALALVMRHIDVEEAALAAHVEVNSQIQLWGEVEDTHDVDYQDVRQRLGSAACLLANA